MNIAFFSDVHGKILLAFKLCARWQQETGEHIDLILQAGDLGAFPDLNQMDRATRRHAEADAMELGFSRHFRTPDPQAESILAQTDCPLVFVRGNHEDHAWLDLLEQVAPGPLFAVDLYERVFCLKTGVLYHPIAAPDGPAILGVGRIGPRLGDPEPYQTRYIQPYELERLYEPLPQTFDILLTHDSARDSVTPGYGMEEICLLLNTYRPLYHLYGHTDRPYTNDLDTNGWTRVIRMHDLHWLAGERGPLPPGVMGLLRWHSRTDHQFEVVTAPWLREYAARGWIYAR